MRSAGLVLVAVLLLASGCAAKGGAAPYGLASPTTSDAVPPSTMALGDGSERAETGVVVAVDGTLATIHSFSIVLGDGSTILLTPQPGLLFDGGPLTHLREHLVNGSPITVTYRQESDALVATRVGDAE